MALKIIVWRITLAYMTKIEEMKMSFAVVLQAERIIKIDSVLW